LAEDGDMDTEHYVNEESRLLRKIKARQASIMEDDIRVSPEAALGRAMAELPRTYAAYAEVRATLARLGVPPTMLKDA
jgi:hypothetical protein